MCQITTLMTYTHLLLLTEYQGLVHKYVLQMCRNNKKMNLDVSAYYEWQENKLVFISYRL